MSESSSPNRDRLLRTARQLRPLLDTMVFVGGQMVEHLVTDPAAVRIRPTLDVDTVVRVTTRGEWYELQQRLATLGFQPDMTAGAPICRMRTTDGLVLDVMPLDEAILGFSNRWYPYAIESAWMLSLAPTVGVRAISAPALLATKWEAFRNRGNDDAITSPDVEDIVTLVAGRAEVLAEMRDAPVEVRAFVEEQTQGLLADPWLEELLETAVPDARRLRGIRDEIVRRLTALARR